MSTNTTMQSEMNRVVAQFVTEVTEIAKRAAREQLDAAFGGGRSSGGSSSSSRTTSSSIGRGRGRGVKRTSEDLDQLADKFYEFVKANPGLRIEQINGKLGTSTKDLQLPIRKMIADGEIKAKGKKRSTTYTAGARKKD
jgi:hypothetical protein